MDQQPQQQNSNQQYPTPDNGQGQFTGTPEAPQNKKTGLLAAIIVAIVVVLGIIFFMAMGSDKKSNTSKTPSDNTSTPSSNNDATSAKFQKYDVTDKMTGAKFSVLFYKDANVTDKNGRTFLISGETGSQNSVYLTAAKDATLDCKGTPSTTMTLNGASTTVCYEPKNTQYAGYVTVNNTTMQLNLAGQKAISMEDAKAILQSVTFN